MGTVFSKFTVLQTHHNVKWTQFLLGFQVRVFIELNVLISIFSFLSIHFLFESRYLYEQP